MFHGYDNQSGWPWTSPIFSGNKSSNPQVLAGSTWIYAWMCRLIPVGCLQVKTSLNTYWYERSGMRIKEHLTNNARVKIINAFQSAYPHQFLTLNGAYSLLIHSWMNVWFPWVGRLPHRNGQLISSPAKRSADGFPRSSAPRSKCETNLAKIYKYTSWSWTAEHLPPLSDWPQATSDPSGKIAANAPSVAWICWTFLSWSWTSEQSPPKIELPLATTDPSAKIAANAKLFAWICCTLLSWSWTSEQSPPLSGLPQATTDPSAKITAHAKRVAWICCTFLSWSWTAEQSPPWSGLPQATTDPSANIAANAHSVAWICPKKSLTHQSRSQQTLCPLPEFPGHSWVDLELRSSRHHLLDCPKQPLGCLQSTTEQMPGPCVCYFRLLCYNC